MDADEDGGGAEGSRDLGWMRGVDGDEVVGFWVVGGAGGYAEEVFVCHMGERERER